MGVVNSEDGMRLSGIMSGKKGIIMGIANERSIAWGIAQACHAAGADMMLTYQSDVLLKRLEPLAESIGTDFLSHCDFDDISTVDKTFDMIAEKWGYLDFLVHAIAYSERDDLRGRYVDTSRDNFLRSLDISCYSFTSVARRCEPLMKDKGGSLLAMTYYGAEKVIPHYNVMGVAKAALESSVRYLASDLGPNNIRVNALSAGPMKTLASSAIGQFNYTLKWNKLNAPLKRLNTQEDVGKAALYLLSDMSSAVTAEIHHVDCGYNSNGMRREDSVGLV